MDDAYEYSDKLKESLIQERIVKEVSYEFKDLPSNAAKIRFTLKLLKDRNLLPLESQLRSLKDDAKALAARTEGNEFFIKKKDYVKALECYNQSLCFSTDGSENKSIAYANRSAIYLNAGFYEFCLENIAAALEHGYPEKLQPKLLKRKEQCLSLMNNNPDTRQKYSEFNVNLSYKPNPNVPCVVECIELAKSDKFGRYLAAKRDFKPGDVLVVEKPYSAVLLKHAVYSYCTHCKKSNYLNLIPCAKSNCVMFCSKQCQDESWKRYYHYESQIVSGIYGLFTKIVSITIRTTLMALTLFNDINELNEFINEIDLDNTTAMDINYGTAVEKDFFRAVYALATNQKTRNVADLFQRASVAAIAFHILMQHTDLKEIVRNETEENIFLEVFFRINQIAASNFHSLSDMRSSEGIDATFSLYSPRGKGAGSFPICSLLNHSCAPNVVRTGADLNIILAIRAIKAGEQLFDNYGAHHCLETLQERKKLLSTQYQFTCVCMACQKNYPLYEGLPMKNINATSVSKAMQELAPTKRHDPETAKRAIEVCSRFLLKHDKHYPCFELSHVQEKQLICARILYLPVPLEICLAPVETEKDKEKDANQ